MGYDARIVIPGYRQALAAAATVGLRWLEPVLTIEAGGIDHRLGIAEAMVEGCRCTSLAVMSCMIVKVFTDQVRPWLMKTTTVLCRIRQSSLGVTWSAIHWRPEILHAHDWQAALVPVLWEAGFSMIYPMQRPLLSIHNMQRIKAFSHPQHYV